MRELDMQSYTRDGFLVVPGLFGTEEVEQLNSHFMSLHARAPLPGLYEPLPAEKAGGDILKVFPRVMHPHRFDPVSLRWLLDQRVFDVLSILLQDEPLAAQSMYYFKPPGARGQQFHQDNYYLQARPATCIAAWTALDHTDEENGGLFVYPGTHTWKVVCPDDDDGHLLTKLPLGDPVPARMNPGDVLFFNGALVHGSQRNATADRWRRSYICHYIGRQHSDAISDFYHPVLDRTGSTVSKLKVPHGGVPCGGEDGNWAG